MCGDVAGMSEKEVSRHIILGLKDMAKQGGGMGGGSGDPLGDILNDYE